MDKQRLHNYIRSSDRAVSWLETHLNDRGDFGADITDLACYYKSPYLFYLAGKTELAHRVLNWIKLKFLQDNGDFTTHADFKSENGAFVEYWAYTNAWIAIAAQKMGRFDIARSAYDYLQLFYHPHLGGFTTHQPFAEGENVVDALTTAHLGLTALYFGDTEKAIAAGNLLIKFIDIQPDLKSGFYLRMNDRSQLLTDFLESAAIFFTVSATQPNQAYFMIGYPIGFLGQLYRSTANAIYLDSAKKYLEFALHCHENIRSFYFSHKVAWGAAIAANLTQETQFIELSQNIADFLLTIQDDSGVWLKEQPAHTYFDQTAENGIWLREISAELGAV